MRIPHIIIEVKGGVCEVNEAESIGSYTYEIRDYDNCSICGGADCSNGHDAEAVHGHQTGI